MQIVCSKCGKSFQSKQVDQKVCADCLRQEFSVAPSITKTEIQEIRDSYVKADKRQMQRLMKMRESYISGQIFSTSGKVQFALGVFIFLFCHFLFFLNNQGVVSAGFDDLDEISSRIISCCFCWVGALLVLFSSRRFKIVAPLALGMLILGWYAPTIWEKEVQPEESAVAARVEKMIQKAEDETDGKQDAGITSQELEVYYEHRRKFPRTTNYAIFLNNNEPLVREIVRDFLTRILEADYTRAYTRTNGVLYIVSNASGPQRNISPQLERMGRVISFEQKDGVFLVKYDAEKANMVCKYSSDVLSSSLHSAFVTANISELTCLDSMRVRMAARSLSNADVQVLRREIRNAAVRVLEEPWSQDQDTYMALVETLVTYALPKDEQAIALCFKYFETRRLARRDVLPKVVDYLVREKPTEMVQPVVEYWLENPLLWEKQLVLLGYRAQPVLLKQLETADDVRKINTILSFLSDHGNAEAVATVESLLNHSDGIIRHSAMEAIKKLRNRH